MKPTKPDYGNWVPLAIMKAMGALVFLLLLATLLAQPACCPPRFLLL